MAKGISIHIGLNRVDPKHYRDEFGRPWDGALAACEFDAKDMQAFAQARGFSTTLLLTEQATARTVSNTIRRTARLLQAGDTLFVTYSGHGGQVPDEFDEETDHLDETWVLYDRQLLDDELYGLWGQFHAGVRIVVLSDSCHSGTATRQIIRERGGAFRPTPTDGTRFRVLPVEVRGATYLAHRRLYKNKQQVHPRGDRTAVQADVLLISGCQDDQLSRDGDRNGLFTGTLLKVWNNGLFEGDYRRFHQDIASQMPTEQQPNLFTFGSNAAILETAAVFAIG
jgi:metacaspase-1